MRNSSHLKVGGALAGQRSKGPRKEGEVGSMRVQRYSHSDRLLGWTGGGEGGREEVR